MVKRAVLLALVVGSNALLDAQIAGAAAGRQGATATPQITRLTGVTMSTGDNVQITADEAEYNQSTGEVALFGTVILRQPNRAGAAFPEPKPMLIRIRGGLEITIGDMTIRADEADVNAQTAETQLRGNVRIIAQKK